MTWTGKARETTTWLGKAVSSLSDWTKKKLKAILWDSGLSSWDNGKTRWDNKDNATDWTE